MNLFICKCCASSKGLYKTSLLPMWVSWDECISWEYIKSSKWSINPKYVNLAIILHIFSSMKSHVPYWWNCKLSSFFWYLSLGYLLPSSMHSNYLFSLSDSCDVVDVIVFEAHLVYNKINMSLWPCYQANILWLYYMNSSWISCSFFSV